MYTCKHVLEINLLTYNRNPQTTSLHARQTREFKIPETTGNLFSLN